MIVSWNLTGSLGAINNEISRQLFHLKVFAKALSGIVNLQNLLRYCVTNYFYPTLPCKKKEYIFQMRLLQRKFFLCICNFNFELNKNFQNCLMVRICLQQTLTDACIPSLHTYLFMYWNTIILQAVGSNAGLNFFP